MASNTHTAETLLSDFEPTFAFEPVPPLPPKEFEERLRSIRRQAAVAGHDALLVHADLIGWYHASNSYLRYVCDWFREGILIIPTDTEDDLHLLSFFSDSVLLPPPGEPPTVTKIWQVAPWGRESLDRPGSPMRKAVSGCVKLLNELGLHAAQVGLVGDATSAPYWELLRTELPRADLIADNAIVDRMQRIRSKHECALLRAAAQLADIGFEAACHVARVGVNDHEVYAAFTFAQLARGGETGDGYQIGINEFGTHCGKPYGRVIRRGDLINLYVSNVTYRGYFAQMARMIAVGSLTDAQETVIEMCVDAITRAEGVLAPGTPFNAAHNAAFSAYIERQFLESSKTRTMPFNWEAMPDGTMRPIPEMQMKDDDWAAQGRQLSHLYPPVAGPHNPNLGHAVGMPKMPLFNVASHNTDRMEPGMAFVLHAQWLEPGVAGCNIGNCYLIRDDGFENLNRHTPVAPVRLSG